MASPYDRAWRAAREAHLRAQPLCIMHKALGRVVAATVVDHIRPHRGDSALFWEPRNWQSLCKRCHDAHKQALEKGGAERGCDAQGVPLDARHHWRAP